MHLKIGICSIKHNIGFYSNSMAAAADSLMGPNLVVRADLPKNEMKIKFSCKVQSKADKNNFNSKDSTYKVEPILIHIT